MLVHLAKTNELLNLINNQPYINKKYLSPKNLYEAKYQYLNNKRKRVCLSHQDDPEAFTECSNDMQDLYKNIEKQNLKKRKLLLVFDDMIADMINNKDPYPVVGELFIRGRKLNIPVVFIMQSQFKVPKKLLNTTLSFTIKIPNGRELQQIALNHSLDVDFNNFMKIHKKYTAKPFFFWLMIQLYHQIIV